MTDNKVGKEPGHEAEPTPLPRIRIGDIITTYLTPGARFLVSQGQKGGDGFVDAFRLHDNDTRVEPLPGTVEASNISAVVGRMGPEQAVNIIVASMVGPNGNPELEADLRGIMEERLHEEQQGQAD